MWSEFANAGKGLASATAALDKIKECQQRTSHHESWALHSEPGKNLEKYRCLWILISLKIHENIDVLAWRLRETDSKVLHYRF